ncbi:MAG: threonylcarbamoyl-AMP synthase [Candidatus Kerfeldbacteria bacterium]|nr:threonylcarbamoyl-AMP synthase [Candidatus Kerfeldbacteria bacterium]
MASLKQAVSIIKAGGVVAYPTESFYALGADATNPAAIARVFRLKGRDKKPIALVASDEQQVSRFFAADKVEREVARWHWPGALTIVLKPKKRLAASALGSLRIGVRVPKHKLAAGLARLVGKPITATSANPSGGRPTKSARRVRAWWPNVPVVAGACGRATKPSTVVAVDGGQLITLRAGATKI